ncbi:MAG: DUF1893 domain-containing protein [Oscillospiraceae bacterium]|nr:DUF1893 domain-containing protein [Oscillospiraceae bacterium]
MTDLEKAKELLVKEGHTCVLCMDDMTFTSDANGIKPLNWWLRDGCRFEGFSAADRVVGRAAAFLYVLLGVKEVYADVLSDSAVPVLERFNIRLSYGQKVKNIMNRTGDDLCPMEKIAVQHEDPEKAYDALKEKIAELMAAKRQG